ncbi:MAG TPA: AAA family ATPase [Puia sp.]|nr:AAA family ATPase [Puia sp.]
MNKPLLIIVTGRPASGKSTLAAILAREIKCPLISRDELKEGYINTLGVQHEQLDNSAAWHIYRLFFEVIYLLVSKGVSLVVEAAFQEHLWKPQLLTLRDKTDIRIIICEPGPDLARARFANRLQTNPDRDRFHGDKLVKETGGLQTDAYIPVDMDVPTLVVDTTDHYQPDIGQVLSFIRKKNPR